MGGIGQGASMDAIIWAIFLFALGACVGSFLNVVIYRLPRGESIAFPGSHCPSCGRAIRWYDNIPLLSWLALAGKCRFCKTRISPRYIIVELVTALLVVGLFAAYYIFAIRGGAGTFEESWPMYAAHAALVCGLLACSAVDIEHWIVPLEVCWVVSAIGIISATAAPHAWMPGVSPQTGAMSLAAGVGIIVAIILQKRGLIQQSFADAQEKPTPAEKPAPIPASKDKAGRKGNKKHKAARDLPAPPSVAFTKAHGINPRKEVLREVLFLAPAFILAVAAYYLVTGVPAIRDAWLAVTSQPASPAAGIAAHHIGGLTAALFGYLIGGLWIWGTRILGTLAFGKEAMGLGDVHIMAAVGAVAGWMAPSIAFFVAPVFGLIWALYLWLRRNQRELPYGPWLAAASVAVMVFHDKLAGFLEFYMELLG